MKKLILNLIAITAILSSCSYDQPFSTEQSIAVGQLSAKIVQYVDNNYPDASISSAVILTNSQAQTIVTLNTTEELAFDKEDNFMQTGEPFHSGCGGHGKGHDMDNHHGNIPEHHNGIPVDSLSSAITGYISMNYSGYEIMHAEKDSLCSVGSIYEVMLRMNDSIPVKLLFDLSGNYLYKASRIDYTNVPQAIKDSITANNSGYNPMHRCEEFILVTADLQYRIFIANGTSHKRVIYNADGTLICEQE